MHNDITFPKGFESNPNSMVYAVAAKTDVDIIVRNLFQRLDFSNLLSVSVLEWYNCVQRQRRQIYQNKASNSFGC